MVKADKTRNFYGVLPKFYEDVMGFNIHGGGGDYVEVDPVELDEVNQEAAELAAGLEIDDRVEIFQKKPTFVNFKDTKPDFSTAALTPPSPKWGRCPKSNFKASTRKSGGSPTTTSGVRPGTRQNGLRGP